jgi:DNA-entry nuclease
MNADTMLIFENKVAEYVKKTNNHVLYRVTPIYEGDNLLATGVQMEASSVEDKCTSICFNVFVYNVQDKIEIDYKNGENNLKK